MRTVLFIIGFVGAGLVGAVFGHVLFPDDAPLPGRSGDDSYLMARVDDLAAEVERLRTAVYDERASRPIANTQQTPAASALFSSEDPAVLDVGDIVVGGTVAPTLTTDDVIEEKVRETVEEIAREQRRERARREEAKIVAKETAWLKGMQADLRMTDYQVEEIGKLLVQRRRAMEAFKQKWAALGEDATPQQKAGLQQTMTDYRESLKIEVLKVVSVDQYEGMVRKGQEAQKKGAKGR
jgi:vacuolar-type H+-ATPase subunit I/STV1